MICVKKKVRPDGSMCGFEIEGHAGYADEGQDIVCAAVSVLSINTVNAIERFTEDDFSVDSGDGGYLSCVLHGKISHDSELLLKTMWMGLTAIADQYGASFIQIRA